MPQKLPSVGVWDARPIATVDGVRQQAGRRCGGLAGPTPVGQAADVTSPARTNDPYCRLAGLSIS